MTARHSRGLFLFMAAALLSAAATIAIFIFMAVLGFPVLTGGRLLAALTGPWDPAHHLYGIMPMIMGSFAISSLAVITAFPLSLGYAAFISSVAPRPLAAVLRQVVRLMTAIPTVVYGFVGIFLLVPLVRELFQRGSGLCVLTAGLVLCVLISPTMILIFGDALRQVPRSHLLAAAGLGATRAQQFIHVMLPHARRGIWIGLLLGLGRALGDTMIALMLAGNAVAPPGSALDSARTLTAHIALVMAADFDSPEFRTLFICGLTLYGLTTVMVLAIRRLAFRSGRSA